ncbi:hypothetical protein [Streptomyces qinzhouensis]|uniref:Uncharacterized protein n=1 Tax=Streptomyces qinzhouensis TaxID=2599401 RepID=A0A5B8JEM2_9ACTN|nr:hypothetical protein [Streptomyces qinzhouensis]QDY79886.1 hypothetical protein FQU76_28860 [Streptomyces qinzhouensis]
MTIRRIKRAGIGPVEAAWQVGEERKAARTAMGLLVLQGAVEISDGGVARAVPDAPEPADPVLSALLDGIRQHGAEGTRLYEILDQDRFAPYRSRLAPHVPKVRRHAEPARTVAAFAACGISFGMTAHGLGAEAHLPFLGGDSALWILLWWPIWGLLWLCTLAWPDENTRRWRSFNRYCRQVAEAALEGLPSRTRKALGKKAFRRAPPRRRRERRADRPKPKARKSDGGDWADAIGTDSCGGGGCGGGD